MKIIGKHSEVFFLGGVVRLGMSWIRGLSISEAIPSACACYYVQIQSNDQIFH